jgi:hypothetical protein
MPEDAPARNQSRIDAAEVTWVEITDDRRKLCLRLRDQAGRPASVSLPVASLTAVLTAAMRAGGERRTPAEGQVHTLEGWSLDQSESGLLLTLHLPDGAAITFAVQPWQIAAIASLAGQAPSPVRNRLN